MAFSDTIFEAGKTTLTAALMNALCEELKEIEANAWKKMYPIGALMITTKPENPASYLGGKWVAYGSGRVLALAGTGTDEEGSQMTLEANEEGGSYKLAEHLHTIPSHNHSVTTNSAGGHTHNVGASSSNAATGSAKKGAGSGSVASSSAGAHTHSVNCSPSGDMASNKAGAGSSENMPPYIVAYAFKRVE